MRHSPDDAPGAAREQDDALAEAGGLAHVVGDEDDRASGRAPDPLELLVQEVAGDGVERGERLVHEEHGPVLGEGAGERDALTHAAGELVRTLLRGIREVHGVQQREGLRRGARARGTPRRRRASSTLRRAVSQGMSADSWNITAEPSAGVSMLPVVGRSSPAMRFSSVDLPHPDAPSRQTNSPGAMSRSMSSSTSGPVAEPLLTCSMRTAGSAAGAAARPDG